MKECWSNVILHADWLKEGINTESMQECMSFSGMSHVAGAPIGLAVD
jgi:hypothetical protein